MLDLSLYLLVCGFIRKKDMSPKLDGYEIGDIIGCGSGGEVRKSRHLATGEIVAIKIICYKGFIGKHNAARQRYKQRGHLEIFVAKHLKHPNVLSCYEGHMRRKRAYIVMDLLVGGSLRDLLDKREGPLTEEEARKYFRQLIHGVAYCHKRLLIHGDLKPANLLLDKSKQHLQIADFGVCNFLAEDLKLKTFVGTDLYRAPEVSEYLLFQYC